jgi:hypothetical protein
MNHHVKIHGLREFPTRIIFFFIEISRSIHIAIAVLSETFAGLATIKSLRLFRNSRPK